MGAIVEDHITLELGCMSGELEDGQADQLDCAPED